MRAIAAGMEIQLHPLRSSLHIAATRMLKCQLSLGLSGSPMVGAVQVRRLISSINEASDHIPGWDEYAQTGKATQQWDGKL